MSRCAEPGEPGFILGLFIGFGINTAIQLSRSVGTGLPLVNALRDRFPEMEISLAGELAGIVGAGSRAMFKYNAGDGDSVFNPNELPTAGNAFFENEPGERYMLRANVFYSSDGILQPDPKTVVLYTTDPLSLDDALSAIQAQFGETISLTDRDRAGLAQVESVEFFFALKRF